MFRSLFARQIPQCEGNPGLDGWREHWGFVNISVTRWDKRIVWMTTLPGCRIGTTNYTPPKMLGLAHSTIERASGCISLPQDTILHYPNDLFPPRHSIVPVDPVYCTLLSVGLPLAVYPYHMSSNPVFSVFFFRFSFVVGYL